jgi:hypothetical protein
MRQRFIRIDSRNADVIRDGLRPGVQRPSSDAHVSGTSPLTRSDVYASIWSQEINLGRSLGSGHLRRLFADFARVKDEFERIGILVFLHQLEIHEPLGIGDCRAVIEPIPGRFKQ